MKLEQLRKFKFLFEEAKKNLSYNHSLLNESFNIVSDDLFDLTDLASSELETSMRMRLRSREAIYLKKIDEALSRIADGTFGDCEECGKEIGAGRLQARPTTTFCIQCKEEKEHLEHRLMSGSRPAYVSKHASVI